VDLLLVLVEPSESGLPAPSAALIRAIVRHWCPTQATDHSHRATAQSDHPATDLSILGRPV